jgi:hypothetical protein
MTSCMESQDSRNLSSIILKSTVNYVLNLGGYLVWVGHAVARLVEALRYKSEGRGFDF